MLSILLLILKITGISLLCILGLILLVVVLVLFVPIRYKADVNYENALNAAARVRWLWPLVNVKVTFDGKKLKLAARVLGIPVFVQDPDEDPEKKRKKEEKKEKKRLKKEEKERRKAAKKAGKETEKSHGQTESGNKPAVRTDEESSGENIKDDVPSGENIKDDVLSGENSADIISFSEYTGSESTCDTAQREQENGRACREQESKPGRIVSSIKKIFGKIRNIFVKIGSIFGKLKNIAGNIGHKKDVISRFWNNGKNRKAFRFLLGILKKVLKHIMPRRIKGTVEFGMDDPSSTGKILGGVYAFYGYIPKKLHIYPDFTGKRIFADVTAGGSIRLFTLLRLGLKVLRSREFKYLRKQFDKLTAELKSNKAA